MTYLFRDSVTAHNLKHDADIAPAYIDGQYANLQLVIDQCPVAIIVPITTHSTGHKNALVYDCEKGDGTPRQAALWAGGQLASVADNVTIYCNKSTWPEVKAEIAALKIKRSLKRHVHYWIADWTNTPHLLPGAVAVQYENTAGYDLSISRQKWPGVYVPLSRRHRLAGRVFLRVMRKRKVTVSPNNRTLVRDLSVQCHRVASLGR